MAILLVNQKEGHSRKAALSNRYLDESSSVGGVREPRLLKVGAKLDTHRLIPRATKAKMSQDQYKKHTIRIRLVQ